MQWLTARSKNKPRLLSPLSLAMVAVGGVAAGAGLAQLEVTLQPQGLPPFLLLTAVPGLAGVATAIGVLVAAHLIPYTKRLQQPWEP